MYTLKSSSYLSHIFHHWLSVFTFVFFTVLCLTIIIPSSLSEVEEKGGSEVIGCVVLVLPQLPPFLETIFQYDGVGYCNRFMITYYHPEANKDIWDVGTLRHMIIVALSCCMLTANSAL